MGALVAHEIFPSADASFVADKIDGSFPDHPPNPLEEAGREPLRRAVLERDADLGVIFDGDADRVMFIDEKGEFVRPDLMIAPIAAEFIRRFPGATILHDIRTSRGVTEYLEESGARPYIWKVGHAFAKSKLRELDAPFGGEFAGHYYFRDFHWCDSGERAAQIALKEFAKAKRERRVTLSEFIAPVVRYANSGELNFRIDDKDAAIARVLAAARAKAEPDRVLDFDGYRLDYNDWWFSIRKSNTEPFLRLIVEARTQEMLEERVAHLKNALGL
jgi:phosphomannomutase